VPLQPEFVDFGDQGTPFVSFQEKAKSAQVFMDIVDKIKKFAER
jgi:hypothetical protein